MVYKPVQWQRDKLKLEQGSMNAFPLILFSKRYQKFEHNNVYRYMSWKILKTFGRHFTHFKHVSFQCKHEENFTSCRCPPITHKC